MGGGGYAGYHIPEPYSTLVRAGKITVRPQANKQNARQGWLHSWGIVLVALVLCGGFLFMWMCAEKQPAPHNPPTKPPIAKQEKNQPAPVPRPGHLNNMFGFPSKRSFFFGLPF
ncbi:MAG: hypothetical protein RBR41_03225 [Desulfovibrio sp.]|uniref:hypothetical protein n=1 Tax=Desulfovibrio sp. TaxID=885 RepID=UPI002A35C480|nr:hypothetical protein [Desulfovibrio sp.]MDY0258663.1 hypothetical protein [Desulfovibrio sp.]